MKPNRLHLIGLELKQSVKRNPVESFLALCFLVVRLGMLGAEATSWWNVVRYAPVVFLLTCIFHAHSERKGVRWLYYLSPLLLIPFGFVEETRLSLPYAFTLMIIQLLYILLTSRRYDRPFAYGALNYVKSAGIALALSLVIWITLWVIVASVSYIFDIWKEDTADLILITQAIAIAFCLPLLFVLFRDAHRDKAMQPAKAFRVLLNYVLSPALMVYTVILYLYMLKILITFELPKGQIAYMVTAFVSAFFILKGCQFFLWRRFYGWFYRWASWITLPTLALCWVGVVYRIREYGFTEPRVYLIAVVSVLTFTALLFFFRRWPHYSLAAWSAVALFSLITYIPGITAKDIEEWSQAGRPESDKSPEWKKTIVIRSQKSVDISDYKQLYLLNSYLEEDIHYQTTRDSLSFYIKDSLVYSNAFSRIFAGQLQKAGLSPTDSIPEEKYPELLRLELDSGTILFEDYHITRTDSGYEIGYMQPMVYLIR